MSAFDYVGHVVIPAIYSELPPNMNTPAAKAMMLAIGLQESRFEHRVQINGPARGFWQFERGGGVHGVLTHKASRPYIEAILPTLCYKPEAYECHEAIKHNDYLAAVFARLLLWTLPGALPARNNPAGGWSQYLSAWRPGKPHRDTWDEFYETAWDTVMGE